jgi:hypothetical protein
MNAGTLHRQKPEPVFGSRITGKNLKFIHPTEKKSKFGQRPIAMVACRNRFSRLPEPSVPPKRLSLFLIFALCRLAKPLNHCEQMGWLVGAVGIEFSKPRNLKELCGLPWRPKSFVVYTWNCRCPRIAP